MGFDVTEHWQTLVYVFETKFDADESLKKIEYKIKAIQDSPLRGYHSKLSKYDDQKAKLVFVKFGAELFDRDWAEIFAIFVLRAGELTGKDRRFSAKAKKILADSIPAFNHAVNTCSKRKVSSRRYFPQSRKDYE